MNKIFDWILGIITIGLLMLLLSIPWGALEAGRTERAEKRYVPFCESLGLEYYEGQAFYKSVTIGRSLVDKCVGNYMGYYISCPIRPNYSYSHEVYFYYLYDFNCGECNAEILDSGVICEVAWKELSNTTRHKEYIKSLIGEEDE